MEYTGTCSILHDFPINLKLCENWKFILKANGFSFIVAWRIRPLFSPSYEPSAYQLAFLSFLLSLDIYLLGSCISGMSIKFSLSGQ